MFGGSLKSTHPDQNNMMRNLLFILGLARCFIVWFSSLVIFSCWVLSSRLWALPHGFVAMETRTGMMDLMVVLSQCLEQVC